MNCLWQRQVKMIDYVLQNIPNHTTPYRAIIFSFFLFKKSGRRFVLTIAQFYAPERRQDHITPMVMSRMVFKQWTEYVIIYWVDGAPHLTPLKWTISAVRLYQTLATWWCSKENCPWSPCTDHPACIAVILSVCVLSLKWHSYANSWLSLAINTIQRQMAPTEPFSKRSHFCWAPNTMADKYIHI